jgi:hypothetical protein
MGRRNKCDWNVVEINEEIYLFWHKFDLLMEMRMSEGKRENAKSMNE